MGRIQSFVAKADALGISLHIGFYSDRPGKETSVAPDNLGTSFGGWVAGFIDDLTSKGHYNVLVWSVDFGVQPPPSCAPTNCPTGQDYWGVFWKNAYARILNSLNSDANENPQSSYPLGRALLSVGSGFSRR